MKLLLEKKVKVLLLKQGELVEELGKIIKIKADRVLSKAFVKFKKYGNDFYQWCYLKDLR
jgi:hypothetical protein